MNISITRHQSCADAILNKVTITAEFLIARVEEELATLNDRRVVAHIRSLMVAPAPQMRAWDYGAPGDAFLCWLVLAQGSQNIGIAYCEQGFGPRNSWGLLFLEGPRLSIGSDCGWFDRFLDAYFESPASSEIPIWEVFRQDGNDFRRGSYAFVDRAISNAVKARHLFALENTRSKA